MKKIKLLVLISMIFISGLAKSQTNNKVLDNHIALVEYWNTVSPSKEKKFSKYIESNHGMNQNFSAWKKENKFQYIKEFWYQSESFYIKRNHFAQGSVSIDGALNEYSIDDSQIDITRFDGNRSQTEEVIVILPGFKDVIVLLPANNLIYKP